MQADFSAVTVVGVDAAREPADKLRAFQQRYLPAGCSVTLLADPGARVSQQYAITVVPTLYVVDGNGKIAAAGFGETTVEPARRLLERLLHG